MKNNTFGGYLPLELPLSKGHYYPSALRYLSARSALFHLLITLQPKRLWMPYLICQSVIDAVISAKIEIEWYQLDEEFRPNLPPVVNPEDFIFFVDYYGQCSSQKKYLLENYPKEQIIFDHSQAFFAPNFSVSATIYSPRKFFGVPDGGLLTTSFHLPKPEQQDRTSVERVQHLLIQHEFGTEKGYIHFQNAESSLEKTSATRMSEFTEQMLLSIDYMSIKQRREHNYRLLHERLAGINTFRFISEEPEGPFCYPLYFPSRHLRSELIKHGVFVATYWKEVFERVPADSVEGHFVNHLLAIPCDQRYSLEDIERVSKIILQVAAENVVKVSV